MKKLLLILLCFPLLTLAQSSPNLLRSTISNSGSSTQTEDNYVVQQSVGQSSPIGLQEASKHTVRQGFIQPAQLKRMLAASNAADLLVSVYPNPTTDKITIAFEELVTGKVILSIYDQMGKLVMEENKEGQAELSYSLANLSAGNYFIKVNTATKEYVTQISKQQ
ncbi:T9SS type A sorting domain-containing protein [Flavobacteriales bacterium]|jgi:hypothetical protein|nr:T9SS type A sorting domain-containing protein [Flavobacteriales bacterium]